MSSVESAKQVDAASGGDGGNIRLTLPDGSVRDVPSGTTGRAVAESIGPRLAKDALAVKLAGDVLDLARPLRKSGPFEVVTPKHPDALELYRHSTAHLCANAVKRLFPGVKIGIGPAIENGFYYDFDPGRPFTPEDLEKIEAEMKKIVAEDNTVVRKEMSKAEAVAIFEAQNDPLKVEIVAGIPEGSLSCYEQRDFIDLCRGPHVPSTGKLGVFKLTHAAGAYWKGDERNPMLQRIYGAVFLTQKELDEHLARLEAARARDHRRLGKELALFVFHPWAPASPFFLPKGATVYNLLIDWIRDLYVKYGYQEVLTPQIFDEELFTTSGHTGNYRENMFFVQVDEREFGVKPMNCPGHCLLFASQAFSYRDLPVRYADFARLHRYEKSGVTQGLTRVRSFSQDDAHIFAAPESIDREVASFLTFLDEVYGAFAFQDVAISLGLRPEKRVGKDAVWDRAEKVLEAALKATGRPYVVSPGDGAFYGPKIDFRVNDAIGRPWQLGTFQCDFNLPELFDLHYTAEDGTKQRPVLLHRAILGSLERFLGILIEHTGGDFPFWLAPEQVRVVPVSEKLNEYSEKILGRVREEGLRASMDSRNEKLGAKIRHGELEKVPALFIVGEKELRRPGRCPSACASGGRVQGSEYPRASKNDEEQRLRTACSHGTKRQPLANSKEEIPIAFFRGGPRVPPTKNSPINEFILRFQQVRLIGSDGAQLGVVDPPSAIAKAREEGLDVVVIAEQADPPVCKIMDFGKFTFEKKKKEHESKKKQKITQVKEIKFRPNIDEHDYDFKLRNILRFLEEGDKVKATVQFRGREMSRLDNGRKVLDRLIKDLEGRAHAESGTEMMGNRMHQILGPIKKH